MAAETSKTTQITLRIPKDWLPRADRLAPLLSRPGLDTGRSDALRAALARGFEILEKEYGAPVAPPPAPSVAKTSAKTKARRSR